MKIDWMKDPEFRFTVFFKDLKENKKLTQRYRYLLLLLHWPIFGMLFAFVERGSVDRVYHLVECGFDQWIPFCEWFIIPYYFWFVYMIGTLVFFFFYDIEALKKKMRFIIFTYAVTMIVYLVYPTYQNLRPTGLSDTNLLTKLTLHLYNFDTNTNVCPSIHVLGSMATMFAAWKSKYFTKGLKSVMTILCVVISLSTVFMKQHSILDVVWAVLLGICGYLVMIVYYPKIAKQAKKLFGKKDHARPKKHKNE